MDEPFAPLPAAALFYRLAERGTTFLPKGAVLPDPLWFRPTSEDVEEAAERGRVPGLSVWDRALTEVAEARVLARKPRGSGFGMTVARAKALGAEAEMSLGVVRDALYQESPKPGWDGHALLEGLHRPAGAPKQRYRDLRASLAEVCVPVE